MAGTDDDKKQPAPHEGTEEHAAFLSARDALIQAAEKLELEHPTLAGLVQRVNEALSGIGI